MMNRPILTSDASKSENPSTKVHLPPPASTQAPEQQSSLTPDDHPATVNLGEGQKAQWEPVQYPVIGEEIQEYHLVAELGQGAQGKVFLARQIPLACRPVVLKLTPCEGAEHLNLARLQHTYIVPLFCAEDIVERNLRLLCMPFLGAITLAQVLGHLKDRPASARTGKDVDQILEEVQGFFREDLPRRGNAKTELGKSSYPAFIGQLALCLAEALDFAHRNELVHLDIKPSNILLAPDGRPLLLDFHLARTPINGGEKKLGTFGGTLRYMSPEQLAALNAVTSGNPVPTAVDRRSDIYSLGVVLFEALGGEREGEKIDPQKLPRSNPCVSAGLADILSKCVAEDPQDRYADAGVLAEDLGRHLRDRPLRGVPNRSWRERWQKWRRRSPLAFPVYSLVAALLVGTLGAGTVLLGRYQDRYGEAQHALTQGENLLTEHRYEEARGVFLAGRARIADWPGTASLAKQLSDFERRSELLRKRHKLHTWVDDMRFKALIDPLPQRTAMMLDMVAEKLWTDRADFQTNGDIPLESSIKERIQADLRDLALLRAEMKVRLAPPGAQMTANQAALKLLDEAEDAFGKHPAILMEQRHYAQALGQKHRNDGVAESAVPQTPWEHAFEARSHLRRGAYAEAENELRRAIKAYPLHYLPHFYLGYCSYRQGKHGAAVGSFSFCLGQDPRSEAFYFRGLCYHAQGEKELALADLDQAIKLDPYLGAGYLARGRLHAEQDRWPEAAVDFRNALDNGTDPAASKGYLAEALCHYAQALIATKNWPEARSQLDEALKHLPDHEKARIMRRGIPD